MRIILFFILSAVFAQDIYVDGNAIYEEDNYAKFDRFTKHGGWNNYDNSSKDEIKLPSNFPILGNTFTLEALFYSGDSTSDYHQKIIGNLIFNGNQYGNSSPHITFIRNDDIYYGFSSNGQLNNRIKADARLARTWQHVAFSFDGTKAKLYVDGVAIDSTSNWAGEIPSEIPITSIGTRFSGKIDEVRIWNVARSALEINQNMYGLGDANAVGLLAYYKMDTNEDFEVIDYSMNSYQASLYDVDILPEYLGSEFCPEGPDGSYGCPFPTILDALENVQGGQSILVKEGRYTDLIFADFINQSSFQEGPVIEIKGENANTIIDGTVEVNANWEPYNLNGNQVYKAYLDMGQISNRANTKIDTIYGVFVNDRYMIPAMPVNFKNPTDFTDGNKDNLEPNTVFSVDHGGAPYAGGYEPGDLANLDTLEEYGFDKNTNTLYIHAGNEIPDSTNVRVRVRTYSLYLQNSDNITFDNFHFRSGAVFTRDASFITFKNSTFSHSWEVGLRHRQMVSSGIDMRHRGNMMNNGLRNAVRNCVFRHVVDAYIFRTRKVHWPVYENILAEYNGWFGSEYWNLKVDDNCVNCNADITNDENYFPDTWRYITMRHNRSGNIGPGKRSLVEYAWIENHYQDSDGSGIGRASGAANKSTTRYCWLFNTNRNGLRFDGNCAGQFGLVHHVISVGNKRGFRIKGDKHNIYHVAAYDNYDSDVNVRSDKYCGDYGTDEHEAGVPNGEGNYNTDIHNVIAGRGFPCSSFDCGDPFSTNNGEDVVNIDPEFLLNESGNWYGRHFPIDNNEGVWSQSFPQLEMENPWIDNRNRSQEQLVDIFGVDPFENDRTQSYDFRPKKGSVFIDNGKVIEGINDGQEEDFYHGESFSGQNRAFVGDAPDIGPYEYGDSVYWIPGYRYDSPSIPIPRDGKQDVPLEYGLAWNYPWAENYSGVSATLSINGPGISETQTLDYPKNVMFVNLLPNSNYNWSVTVQGIPGSTSGENWIFTTTDKVYPLNDRSLNINVQDSTYLPSHMQHLTVSDENYTFFKFHIPRIIDALNTISLNLTPSHVESNFGGMVLYQFLDTLWTEKLNESNIGFSSFENLTPLDTIFSLQQNIKSSINIKPFITNGGLHSFALGAIESSSYISFYSKENLTLEGNFNSTVPDHNSGYATNHDVWPSISFELQDDLTIKNNLLPKAYALHQNFPNPFNPITTIHFDLPKESNVKISVYDILGRSIKELVNEKQSLGFKSIKWDATNNFGKRVSAGLYIYSIEAENFRQTKKMVLLK